jgi:hypothetical protein
MTRRRLEIDVNERVLRAVKAPGAPPAVDVHLGRSTSGGRVPRAVEARPGPVTPADVHLSQSPGEPVSAPSFLEQAPAKLASRPGALGETPRRPGEAPRRP